MKDGSDGFREALAGLLPQLRAFARFLARDPARADDLVQEAVVRAMEREAQWQAGSDLRAWCFRILRNLFLDQQRRRAVEARGLADMPARQVQPPAQPGAAELGDLADAIGLLPPAQREALLLVAALEFEIAEAAAVIGVPPGTVKARVSRARATLARRLGERI
ncbi:sigma-70 family RNA polymerase sigma factor [Neoroseomonas soli]|uniref:Sigma-70 family RNA polymerase sigma factor n=1 Tax=Neoroseomonas soli TaxID=1081025 RepID=A0A9X9X2Y2_9PROT|nr:sigma-70 family RNA polymerase sigma factor [Neoroseomonas soli]MBR0673761.1 sigma-70 family RNA polymerase sigma factor [Neoroseomonas soli]